MNDKQVTASLLGAPDVRATGATRDKAVAALRTKIDSELADRDLIFIDVIFIDVEAGGVSALAGNYHDDASLAEISEEAYRARDTTTEV